MLGGAAAEAAARAYPGQERWHVINYSEAGDTAHLTTLGDGRAGVTYYLTGLQYLLEKTAERQPGVRRVVYDKHPGLGQLQRASINDCYCDSGSSCHPNSRPEP